MKFYIIKTEEFSGWDCNGHEGIYIVAANSEQEAMGLLSNNDIQSINEFKLPDISRKKKPFVLKI